ncbi:DUF5117 domain-containing protein, partial [Verrucomicrobia bacterium]|nr:DUF5117 domain-containing protein [Verrucomicrobiota bacterium]
MKSESNVRNPVASARIFLLLLLPLFLSGTVGAEEDPKEKDLDSFVENFSSFDGFFPFYWDNENGKVWIEVDRWNEEFLYVPSLQSGIGSNPIGLDRGLLGGEKVVKFVRIGPKVLLVEPNQRYRAQTKDQSERKAVEDSFAQSVIWGFEIEQSKGDRILIDATPFLVRDSMGIVERLSSDNHGSYKLDDSRSAIHL